MHKSGLPNQNCTFRDKVDFGKLWKNKFPFKICFYSRVNFIRFNTRARGGYIGDTGGGHWNI